MGEAIGQTLPLAVGVAISPIGIIACVMMLATGRPTNGLAFLAGWFIGLAVVCWLLLQLNASADPTADGHPAEWTAYAKIVFGVLLLGVARRQWRKRPADGEGAETPKWMSRIDGITPRRSAQLAFLLGAVNPKNLILTLGAATAIAQTSASGADQTTAVIAYALIGSIGAGVPVAIYYFMGDRSDRMLAGLKERMTRNGGAIMAVICVVIAAKLIGDAITTLSLF